jgi:hypothetical protein
MNKVDIFNIAAPLKLFILFLFFNFLGSLWFKFIFERKLGVIFKKSKLQILIIYTIKINFSIYTTKTYSMVKGPCPLTPCLKVVMSLHMFRVFTLA